GLGLAIDYSLLVLTRYREELAGGSEPFAAVVRSVQTGGRTVVFSACTVAASLSALLVFPFYYLRSFAYAGIIVVLLSAVSATVVLPALLAVLGRNVDRLALWRRAIAPAGTGFWHRLATRVMRRPLPVAAGIITLLLFLGAPFLNVHFGQPDDRMLPPSASTRQASDQIREGFDANESNALVVVAPTAGDPVDHQAEVDGYARSLSVVDGVNRVDAFTGSYIGGQLVLPPVPAVHGRFGNSEGTWLSVVPSATVDPQSSTGEQLAGAARAVPAPFDVGVGGPSARLIDSKESLARLVPLALVIIAIVTFITLFLLFGSLLVPLKAVVLNLLSLTATFGAMVWIFQEGHGSGLLDVTATGNLEVTTPILMFCIAFGLSMDYEVFLLSRIKEAHDDGHDNASAVALGLERTGGIVTAAAALMGIVFLAFGFSDVAFLKLFGVGLTMAVLVDATLIRGLLVPAFMRLAGNANWWAPAPLRRFHDRWGISESAPRHAPTKNGLIPDSWYQGASPAPLLLETGYTATKRENQT
ncbi:MAG: MMPL family transporter, partial [Acidimicrobiales bacterium]